MLSGCKPELLKTKHSARWSDAVSEWKSATKITIVNILVGIAWEELRREKDIQNAQVEILTEPRLAEGEISKIDGIDPDAQVTYTEIQNCQETQNFHQQNL